MEDGRERDGVFETSEFVHVVECTVSHALEKARNDSSKITKLIRKLVVKKPTKFIKGWFVTLDEPTAEQRTAVKETVAKEKLQAAQVVAVSFDQFRAQLVDARSYLDRRRSYPFGSVRDPTTGASTFNLQYMPLTILDQTGNEYDAHAIGEGLLTGASYILVGDYGAGKSATMRELFLDLAERFWRNKTLTFPILLNLRDHHGQTDPVEALERHARRIGFADQSSLVRAWRGGFAVLLLDGFDEIAAAGWAGKTKTLKELRFRSMELVRSFVREAPAGVGVILAGRAHFFDSQREMETALTPRRGFGLLQLAEFSEEQLSQFLGRHGWSDSVPEWLPSRPLLLAYLVSRNLLTPEVMAEAGTDPATGWDTLLSRIADREAELEAGIDPETVRHLIEHVAMLARNSFDGLGPLSPDAILGAFRVVCGYPPDDRGAVLLQRLPGLGGHQSEDGSRVFVDADFVEAARGGAIARIVENPYALGFDTESWQSSVRPLAAQIAALKAERSKQSQGQVLAALHHVLEHDVAHTVAADLAQVLLELGESIDSEPIYIREVIVPELRFDDPSGDLHAVEFQDSVVGTLAIGPDFPVERLPKFVRTHFGEVEGRTGAGDLPADRFVDCEYDGFEEPARTTNAIMSLGLPVGTKVMLTVLKKLYAQKGAGRKEAAFYRGLDTRAQACVGQVLALLRREGLVAKSSRGTQQIWLCTRSRDSRRRALALLAAPNASVDSLIEQSRAF